MNRFALLLVTLALTSCTPRTTTTTPMGALESERHCAALALHADASPQAGRYFGNLASGKTFGGNDWREFVSVAARSAQGDNLYEIADVWSAAKYGSLVRMSFTAPSGDWIAYADYCFTPAGALTTVESELRTQAGGMIVNRRWTFDASGTETPGPTAYRELSSGLPTDAKGPTGRGFQDFDVPFFKSVQKLPFWNLLSAGPSGRR